MNATRQTVAPHEVIVVNNRSTDRTCDIVEQFQRDHPEAPVILLQQNEDQGLIPTRNFGLNAATGDVLGRIDADCMLNRLGGGRVRHLHRGSGRHGRDRTGGVLRHAREGAGLAGDDHIRRHTYRADNDQVLLFGSNMAIRASAWHAISGEVCRDPEDVMHEDIDVSLHLLNHGFKTVYSQCMICGISARRMDTSFASFHRYMQRFKNTFAAHPDHWREHHTERRLYALYPWLHMLYPIYQQHLAAKDINPAEKIWFDEQIKLVKSHFDNPEQVDAVE